MRSMAEEPILIDEERDKENSLSPPHPTTPVSEKPTRPPVLMRIRPSGKRLGNVLDYVYRILIE